MKRMLMLSSIIILLAGFASAATEIGMYNSSTSHERWENEVHPGVGLYHIYLWVNPDPALGLKAWEFLMDNGGSGDMVVDIVLPEGSISVDSPFENWAWAVVMPNTFCAIDWMMVADIEMFCFEDSFHAITIVNANSTGEKKFLDCDDVERPLSVKNALHVNPWNPIEKSSWGAVKSLYR